MFYQSAIATIQDQDVIWISTNDLDLNYYDMEHIRQISNWSGESSNVCPLITIWSQDLKLNQYSRDTQHTCQTLSV